jgi:hypothetical protein
MKLKMNRKEEILFLKFFSREKKKEFTYNQNE